MFGWKGYCAGGADDQADRGAQDHASQKGDIRTRSTEVRGEQRGAAEGFSNPKRGKSVDFTSYWQRSPTCLLDFSGYF